MTEFKVTVVRLGEFKPHPNADTLDITKVFDYTVVAKRGNFKAGDLAVYVPIDSLVPDNDEWNWLSPLNTDGTRMFLAGAVPDKYRVIDAKKIRGIFSQGCLAPLPEGTWSEGDDVRDAMGIVKYVPPNPLIVGGECEQGPSDWTFVEYTDIEGIRRCPDVLNVGEEVVLTEKLHGMCYRACHDGTRLWVGSHTQIKRRDPKTICWKVAIESGLEEKLAKAPMHVFFGEVFGKVQNLNYGITSGAKLRIFDVFDVKNMRYLDHDDAVSLATSCGLEWVPTLYRGAWKPELNELCEGPTMMIVNEKSHIREGFVVKPVRERWDERVGRVILKRHGEVYLLTKKR
jgi:RNA ligase (TIGR02306 family)